MFLKLCPLPCRPLVAAITGYRLVGVPDNGSGNITLPVGLGKLLPNGQVSVKLCWEEVEASFASALTCCV